MTQNQQKLESEGARQLLVPLLQSSVQDERERELLLLLFTQDELSVLEARIQIIRRLLDNKESQRTIQQELGVGIATITRGSNSLKSASPSFKEWLETQLL